MTLDNFKKLRKVLRTAFTRYANELGTLLSADDKDLTKIRQLWKAFQKKSEDIDVLNVKIVDLATAIEDEDSLQSEMDGQDAYTHTFIDLEQRMNVLEQEAAQDSVSVADSIHSRRLGSTRTGYSELSGKRKFKLPIIEFKKFTGEIKEWLGFWAQFKKIHEDPDIDKHDKFSYLIQATVADSHARRLVESYPHAEGNYDSIIECLKSRFGQEDLQIEVYIRELLKLIINNAMSPNKLDICSLYDRIESHLRALDTLGIAKTNCAATLFPLIESCLSESLLRAWHRSSEFRDSVKKTSASNSPLEGRLRGLIDFLKSEVEGEQRIVMATENFGLNSTNFSRNEKARKIKPTQEESQPRTAAGLVNYEKKVDKCIFCEGTHESDNCFKGQKYSIDEKKKIVSQKGACYTCLKKGHMSRQCRVKVKCAICFQRHFTIMCPNLENRQKDNGQEKGTKEEEKLSPTLTCQNSSHVFLQTLRVTIFNGRISKEVRVLLDTGSQRSYILSDTAKDLGYQPIRSVKLAHALFGGQNTSQVVHTCFKVSLRKEDYSCTVEVLDQPQICSEISPVNYGGWIKELNEVGIRLTDVNGPGPIELLLGADILGKLYTGRRKQLKVGLVAMETLLGWTIMGKMDCQERSPDCANISMLVKDAQIPDLWKLDVLGITDPTETKSRQELAISAKEMFEKTVMKNEENRYEVCLPWLEDHPPLGSNYNVAKRRLKSTVEKLKKQGLLEAYDQVFQEWLDEKIIEEVPEGEDAVVTHYLPHRAVIKDHSTTKIRPVFDASSCEKGKPSLNTCLEVGPNLIESIPLILLRFRKWRYGVTSDIKKAFLQISLQKPDRNFLRFLWITSDDKERIFRHKRVVFGVSSSPFLLGATIDYHLEICKQRTTVPGASYSLDTVQKLSKSFYVDNCVTSVEDESSLLRFIKESSVMMSEGGFDLRGWEHSGVDGKTQTSVLPVLGLNWDPSDDVLSINGCFSTMNPEDPTTKREILSIVQKVFDPIGFTCPATLYPKLIIQKTWKKKLGWDEPVDEEIRKEFFDWRKELHLLSSVKIPRWVNGGTEDNRKYSLHIFCDASKDAYAAVIYLRVKENERVTVHLLSAKTRVTPLKKISIPRLELLAATIGARLYNSLKNDLDWVMDCFFWSDSSTVLAWIKRKEEWSVFIRNRVNEIRLLTPVESWRHIPGSLNPADLPSRGCSVKQLIQSKWWEGPNWLYEEPENWPSNALECDEQEINQEKKGKVVSTMVNRDAINWHLDYFSKYSKSIRMMAWIFRFLHNIKNPGQKRQGVLSTTEVEDAEIFVLKQIQNESFQDVNDKRIAVLKPFYDKSGLIRLKSQISQRKDIDDFCFPILLPQKHPVVNSLILQSHKNSCHAGVQTMLCTLREKYWVLGGRRTVRSAIDKCSTCKRHGSKRFEVDATPLPLDRVRDAAVFEVTGVDFAGPLFLKSGEKAWICLFTCAVYRAVHLELATSLSTTAFLQVLRRFIARRGRPKTIYSDNGTNFVGTENCFSRIDWSSINEFSAAQRIIWRFNPPTASWWGGFWERLIGVLKPLLRKVLHRASLTYEELLTVMCDCESVINSRPLTYVSDNPQDLVPLTPNIFLHERTECGVPDCDNVDGTSLIRRAVYLQKLRETLRARFRSEYLGQLKHATSKKPSRPVRLNEIVLIGNDNSKRLDWPLGRVVEFLPGNDGKTRLVRLQTANGQLLRPLQRLFPLEATTDDYRLPDLQGSDPCKPLPNDHLASRNEVRESDSSGVVNSKEIEMPLSESARVKNTVSENLRKCTRSGRIVKPPQRFSY